jgi:L-lactate permease
MDSTSLLIIVVLVPFVALFVGFMVFKADALLLSAIVLALEIIICNFFFDVSPLKLLESSLWGCILLWTGALLIWAAQIFSYCYQITGLLDVLLNTLGKIMPTKEGKALMLVSVVGGYLGVLNGFAVAPVTIPGMKKLGFAGVRAIAAFLVYYSWAISYVSLFIAAHIASEVTQIPIEEIAQVMGLVSLPLCVLSTIAFCKMLDFNFREKNNLALATITISSNMLGLIIFTQIVPSLYILTLVASATFCLIGFSLFSRICNKDKATKSDGQQKVKLDIAKAIAPLLFCMILVILFSYPLAGLADSTTFSFSLWEYEPVSISLLNAPGIFILYAAIFCLVFRIKKTLPTVKDIGRASKKAIPTLLILFCGAAMVQLMIDSNQIALLVENTVTLGGEAYLSLMSAFSVFCSMTSGIGIPAVELIGMIQMAASHLLGITPAVLVGIGTVMGMGVADQTKPFNVKFNSTLGGIKGKDGELFMKCLPWQIASFALSLAIGLILLLTGYTPVLVP